tara:strand:+ start:304 stop:468 length:165 start_codon:yes stop_codon:yes gene_type:complete
MTFYLFNNYYVIWQIVIGNAFLAFFLVVAIGQIFPRSFANLIKSVYHFDYVVIF